jgi:polyhydroxyalkanoate synthesis regulator phasin
MSDQSRLESADLTELIDHLVRTSRLSNAEAVRLVDEVLSFLSESVEDFVRRRHLALQAEGMANAAIFARIGAEIALLRFRVGPLSERQIRRIVYG